MRNWLKTLREGKGLTMKAVGEKLSISESYYCSIENGSRKKKLDLELAAKLAEIFEIPISKVIQLESDPVAREMLPLVKP